MSFSRCCSGWSFSLLGPSSRSSSLVNSSPTEGAVIPLVLHLFLVVTEKLEVQPKAAIGLQSHDFTHLGQVSGLAVRRQAHHLVLVAVMRKTD
jgi:hypothetical protein